MSDAERLLLLAVARVVLSGEGGTLEDQLDRPYEEPRWPATLELASESASARQADEVREIEVPDLTHANGRGGFSVDGREYVMVLEGAEETPLPWANVLANPSFGSVVTAAGPSFSWSENSRENRLTTFANDPVTEATVRPSTCATTRAVGRGAQHPAPCAVRSDGALWIVRHGAGMTRYVHQERGIRSELPSLSIPPSRYASRSSPWPTRARGPGA
jgi:cyclic beta-1,2-glucan synthetase